MITPVMTWMVDNSSLTSKRIMDKQVPPTSDTTNHPDAQTDNYSHLCLLPNFLPGPSASPVDSDSQTNLTASHFSLSHPSHHSPGHHPFFQNNFCSPPTTCCFFSCPSSIYPPCGSHRDICKIKIKSCYSPKAPHFS